MRRSHWIWRALGAAAMGLIATGTISAQATPTTRVRGRIIDYIEHTLVPGAMVQLASKADPSVVFSTESDSAGMFAINGVPVGDYLIGFYHPAVEDLALQIPPTAIHVAGDSIFVPLGTPSAQQLLSATCKSIADSTGLVIGRVVDAETGTPIPNATVHLSWMDILVDKGGLRQARHVARARSTDQGFYGVCGVPTEGAINLVATVDSIVGGTVEANVGSDRVMRLRLGLSRTNRTVALGDSAAPPVSDSTMPPQPSGLLRGSASLHGRVTSDSALVPVQRAVVSVRGSGLSATSDASGRYALGGLPSGTFTLDVRAIGRAPRSLPVTLRNGGDTTANVTLGPTAQILDAVQVFGKAPDANAFLQRRKRGIGRFITAADIERIQPFDFIGLMRTIPSVRVLSTKTGHVIRFRDEISSIGGACAPVIYLNGLRLLADEDIDMIVDPRSITGLEIYTPAEAPIQFFGGSCASVVIWSGMIPK